MTVSDVNRITGRPVIITLVGLAALGVIALFSHGTSPEHDEGFRVANDSLRGGPDPFGYTYRDSGDVSGPPFGWIDISGSGTNLGLADDSNTGFFQIGFDFVFYGVQYSEINISSEGNVTFGTPAYVGHDNVCIPGLHAYGSGDYPMIAVFWDNIEPTSVGSVHYDVRGSAPNRRGVIAWEGFVEQGGQENTISFEVILEETDNAILMQYLDVHLDDTGATCGGEATIGIQDFGQDASFGLEYSCNDPSLSNNLAILFQPSLIFDDGFESGDTRNWSRSFPE
jgi:hypothetical protein